MQTFQLGKSNLEVTRSGFGAIPIQRLSDEDSTALLRAAYDGGIRYYDTARAYTTSESKLAKALGAKRHDLILATKTAATTKAAMEKDLETSLRELDTDYIDLYQFHNPAFLPIPGGEDGLYDYALHMKKEGKIRHIGITSHKLPLARQMVTSGLFDTLQFPMSSLATKEELELVTLCKEHQVGFIAMKGLAGGLITNAASTFAFLRSLDCVLPIWGIQFMHELEEFLRYETNPPLLDEALWDVIYEDRKRLQGNFCRGCGYCLPCPANINIPQAARMELLLGRAEISNLLSADNQQMMENIENCIHCDHCKNHCPYGLNTPELLEANLAFYKDFINK